MIPSGLARGGLGLGGRALGLLLANNTASGMCGGGLGLLSLLDALSSGALLLALLDGGGAGCGAGLRSLRAALLDDIKRGTNNGTLDLHLLAATSLGCLLRDTLSPLSAAENSPRNATRVLALKEKRLGLAILEAEDLAVGADEELALARVDLLTGEGIVVGSHDCVGGGDSCG